MRGSLIEGSVQIYNVAVSVNLSALTLEQVTSKRKKLLADMQPGLEHEVRATVKDKAFATDDGVELLVQRLAYKNACGPLAHSAEWYNSDESSRQWPEPPPHTGTEL